jgi:four helix bundle protein
MIKNFKTLDIWKRACRLVKVVYKATKVFPKEELYGLTSQMRRAAVSVPSNISEGCGRRTVADLSRFLDISVGSLCELETQLYLANDLDFLQTRAMQDLVEEIGQIRRMVIAYQNRL